jgi:sulfide dehydrogenase [flavocytochrome c] flavoprotein subunit
MRDRDTFVMTVPKSPYRCPPGPYERACVVADYLKRKKLIFAKVVVLDANPSIQAEPLAFGEAFNFIYKGMIEYVPNATVTSGEFARRVAFKPRLATGRTSEF